MSEPAIEATPATEACNLAGLYIDLLKRCVGNFIYDDDDDLLAAHMAFDERTGFGVRDAEPARADAEAKRRGDVWPSRAHTMIGRPRLDNLQYCVQQLLREAVPGDLIETGVWRGGATIFMRGILKAYAVTDRRVWVADSFQGLPEPDRARYPQESPVPFHIYRDLAVSLETVRANFARYDLLDEQVRFLPGWFEDTLPNAPIERLALMRLDGDMYSSTIVALQALYPKLAPGGFVIIDDYNVVESANAAVHDFRRDHGIAAPLTLIEASGAWWRK